ncbi:MAG TPA: type II secretion system major pseudopilin GspG [Chthoniobacteraceae bacterium]
MKLSPSSARSGFTLMEIMLVVMIIALLATAAITMLGDNLGFAGETKTKADIQTLSMQLTSYRGMNGDYPTTEQGLKALMTKPTTEPKPRSWRLLMKELPRDQWHREYHYEYPGKRNPDSFDLYSAGKNKIPGDADDLGNWKTE